jgi:hypothetical protein
VPDQVPHEHIALDAVGDHSGADILTLTVDARERFMGQVVISRMRR